MTITLFVLCIIFLIMVALTWYLLIRNNYVRDFKLYLNDTGCDICMKYLNSIEEYTESEMLCHEKLRSIWLSIADISYDKMLFSFKPLREEYWLTQEQQAFLNLRFDGSN